jgi:opacity protein-like surface antigen
LHDSALLLAAALVGLAAPAARAAQQDRWWVEGSLGQGQLDLASTPAAESTGDSGLDLGLGVGVAATPQWRVGLAYHSLVTAIGWCYWGCTRDQKLDSYQLIARYCLRPGCHGWYFQGAGGVARYQDSDNFAWAANTPAAAGDRNGRGSGYELGVGYRFHGRRTQEAGVLSVNGSVGGGTLSADNAGAYGYHFTMARVTVSLTLP